MKWGWKIFRDENLYDCSRVITASSQDLVEMRNNYYVVSSLIELLNILSMSKTVVWHLPLTLHQTHLSYGIIILTLLYIRVLHLTTIARNHALSSLKGLQTVRKHLQTNQLLQRLLKSMQKPSSKIFSKKCSYSL